MSEDPAFLWEEVHALQRERDAMEIQFARLEDELQKERDRRVEHRQMNQSLNEQVQALQAELERRTAWGNEQIASRDAKLRERYRFEPVDFAEYHTEGEAIAAAVALAQNGELIEKVGRRARAWKALAKRYRRDCIRHE